MGTSNGNLGRTPAGANSSHRAPRHHPHPAPPADARRAVDVLVVGGGHAGVEAALAAARLGARVALVTLRADRIGEMSCNPAIGGVAKGQLAREVDALGGAMGLATDQTGIQFRMLNSAKGFAVQGPRAQADRHRYREAVTEAVRRDARIEVREDAVDELLVETSGKGPKVVGAKLGSGASIHAAAVVITTGTFLSAIMHTGESQSQGGRVGEGTTQGISRDLARLGLELGRLKTGTPPRLAREGIAWDRLEPQHGDALPLPFSFRTALEGFPTLPQVPCYLSYTDTRAHDLIRANIHRAPMYAGRIQGVGPRYCPSVEDKVMRFPERERHQVFLEPEGLDTDVIYVNGLSTSLPKEVQEEFLALVPGLEKARILRHGYAVEYDFCQPAQLDPTLHVLAVPGLFLAGQINGTSGYEEAAAQGLLAGANAALWVRGDDAFVLGRDEAYAGVLVDDLTALAPREPYRMFTSRAEYRLLLRQDDVDRRLVRRAAAVGLVDGSHVARLEARERKLAEAVALLGGLRTPESGGKTLLEWLRRPEVTVESLKAVCPAFVALELPRDLCVTLEADVKYEGYVERARLDVARAAREESTEIPSDFDYAPVRGLGNEAREKLSRLRPRTLGAAGRIAGVNPPDVALLSIHVQRARAKDADAKLTSPGATPPS